MNRSPGKLLAVAHRRTGICGLIVLAFICYLILLLLFGWWLLS